MEILYGNQRDAILEYPVGDNIRSAINYAARTSDVFKLIEKFKHVSVNIYCRGSSGAILAALFATCIPNPVKVVHIKKPNEEAHCDSTWFSDGVYINVVIDDFISSGATINAIYDQIDTGKVHVLITQRVCNSDKLHFKPDIFITLR